MDTHINYRMGYIIGSGWTGTMVFYPVKRQIGGVLGRTVSSLTTARQNAINFNKFGSLNFIGNTISVVETFQGGCRQKPVHT